MPKFTRKPIIVHARRLTVKTTIDTLEGQMVGNVGDWVVIGVASEEYPCKHNVFMLSYEPADEEAERYLKRVVEEPLLPFPDLLPYIKQREEDVQAEGPPYYLDDAGHVVDVSDAPISLERRVGNLELGLTALESKVQEIEEHVLPMLTESECCSANLDEDVEKACSAIAEVEAEVEAEYQAKGKYAQCICDDCGKTLVLDSYGRCANCTLTGFQQ